MAKIQMQHIHYHIEEDGEKYYVKDVLIDTHGEVHKPAISPDFNTYKEALQWITDNCETKRKE